MPRPPRLQYEGACYHAYHRGNRRERIFRDDHDYEKFETFMIEAMNWSGVQLYDWSLMPNHFHFLVETPEGNLSEFMQRLLTRYAKYFNWRHGEVGHVFQGRYGARLCDKEQYFLELVRYVELNPYRLKKGMLAKLGEWKWSSLRFYLGEEEPPEGMKRAMDEVLQRFGKTPEEARRALMVFLSEGLASGTWEDFYKPKGNRYLGEETFIERTKHATGEPVRAKPRRLRRLETFQQLAELALERGAIDLQSLCSPSQKRTLSRWRQALVTVGRRYFRFSVQDMARYLNRDATAVSHMLQKGGGRSERLEEVQKITEWIHE